MRGHHYKVVHFVTIVLFFCFSLDVEGLELSVLETIPFDKLDISTLAVEFLHGDKDTLRTFMESKGYTVHSTISVTKAEIGLYAHDYIFVKKGLA